MGLDIILEDDDGIELDSVSDPGNVLSGLLPAVEDRRFRCLNFVHPYTDTVFNKLQMHEMRSELKILMDSASSEAQRRLLTQIDALLVRGLSQVSSYLKFYGE